MTAILTHLAILAISAVLAALMADHTDRGRPAFIVYLLVAFAALEGVASQWLPWT